MLLGFSQGGCLALEFAARNPQRYGAVVGLSAGLIENGDKPRAYSGTLAGTPVFLGCSDVDFHIALERVERTAEILAHLGGEVDKRIYRNMGHTVIRDEIEAVQQILDRLLVNLIECQDYTLHAAPQPCAQPSATRVVAPAALTRACCKWPSATACQGQR